MSLGSTILKLRKEKNITQEELAEKIGVSRQTISNWELNVTSPNFEQLEKISTSFEIPMSELLRNTSNSVDMEYSSNFLLIFFIPFILIIILIVSGYFAIKSEYEKKNNLTIIEKSIYCKLYGEEHGYTIKYALEDEDYLELFGDKYFSNILSLDEYKNPNKIIDITNDYVKKNKGYCETFLDRNLNDYYDISFKKNTLSNTGVTLIIKQTNNMNKIFLNDKFYLEKYENYKWKKLDYILDTPIFPFKIYKLNNDKIIEFKVYWESYYGKLNKGIYKITKEVQFESDNNLNTVEFFHISKEFEIK